MSLRSLTVALVFIAAGIVPASAERQPPLCASARADLAKDALLARAMAAAFPRLPHGRADSDCVFPLDLLHFPESDQQLTTATKPGEACHGCGASLSAFVLTPPGPGGRLVASFKAFTETGTFGDPGRLKATRLAGHDAIAIESGGTFQGYTSRSVAFALFEGGKLTMLAPLPLSADNEGAVGEPDKTISVDGAWRIGPTAADTIRIAYKVTAKGRTRQASAVWRLKDGKLVLVDGKIPPEQAEAGGGE